ncbi:MAG: hypothetical protein BZ151_09400, partial [Desulfobacca sp. 4484_104]
MQKICALFERNFVFIADGGGYRGLTGMGELTDIGYRWDWFRGPSSNSYMRELYDESRQAGGYYVCYG